MEQQDAISEVMDSLTGLYVEPMMQENFFSIVHQISDIIYKIDDQGRFVFINDSIRKLGYEPKDLLDKHFTTIIHPDDIERVQLKKMTSPGNNSVKSATLKCGFFDERRTGNRITRNLTVRLTPGERAASPGNGKKSGTSFNVISTGAYDCPTEGAGRIFTGSIGIIRELVPHNDEREEPCEMAGLYRAIVENASDIITVLAGNGTILYCSPSVERVLGYDPESLVGEFFWGYVHDQDAARVTDSFLDVGNDTSEFECAFRFRGHNGSWRPINNRGAFLRDSRGKTLCVVMCSSDISTQYETMESMKRAIGYLERRVLERTAELERTKKKLASEISARGAREEESRQMGRLFRALAEKTDEIVIELDANGTVNTVNPAVLGKTGFMPKEITGMKIAGFIHEDDRQVLDKMLLDVWDHSDADDAIVTADREIRMIRKDLDVIWIEARCRPLTGTRENIRGFTFIASDITGRKKKEQDSIRSAVMDLLAAFADRTGRDLNNVLEYILSIISLIRMNLMEGDAAYEYSSHAEDAAVRALDMARRLLVIARVDTGGVRRVSLPDLVRVAALKAVEASEIFCRFSINGRMKKVNVNTSQMGQAIKNVVLNACQAMNGKGEIVITVDNYHTTMGEEHCLAPGDYARISVADIGCGISPEHIQRVFDPFYTTKEDGIGMGLAVSYSIMKKHGGHISIKSVQGQGTEVILYLPVPKNQTSSRQKKGK